MRAESVVALSVAVGIVIGALALSVSAVARIGTDHPIPPVYVLWIAGVNVVLKESLYRYKRLVARRLDSRALLATAWDQNAFSRVSSPVGAAVERVAEGWLVDLLGLPEGTSTSFVTGATMANVTGLVSARSALLKDLGWHVEEQGLFGAPEITVVVGDEVHASMRKALAFMGFGRER